MQRWYNKGNITFQLAIFSHLLTLSLLLTGFFTLQITNTYFFETTKALEFMWAVHGDGCELGSEILSLPPIDPMSSYEIKWKSAPWYSLWASSAAAENFLTVNVKLLQSTRWVESGHVIASAQVQLPAKREFVPHVITLPVSLY